MAKTTGNVIFALTDRIYPETILERKRDRIMVQSELVEFEFARRFTMVLLIFLKLFFVFFSRNVWLCVSCDLKFLKRETVMIHRKLHEDEFDVERITLTDTTCPECDSVSMDIHVVCHVHDWVHGAKFNFL